MIMQLTRKRKQTENLNEFDLASSESTPFWRGALSHNVKSRETYSWLHQTVWWVYCKRALHTRAGEGLRELVNSSISLKMVLYTNVTVGQRVEVLLDGNVFRGTVKYKGFITTRKGDWVGVALDEQGIFPHMPISFMTFCNLWVFRHYLHRQFHS